METSWALLALCEEDPSAYGGWSQKKTVLRILDIFVVVSQNKELGKVSMCMWFETELLYAALLPLDLYDYVRHKKLFATGIQWTRYGADYPSFYLIIVHSLLPTDRHATSQSRGRVSSESKISLFIEILYNQGNIG